MDDGVCLGIDVGTSGVRAALVDEAGKALALGRAPLPPPRREKDGRVLQDPELWWRALTAALADLRTHPRWGSVRAVALDATSGTVLAVDESGRPLGPARLYDDTAAREEAARIAAIAPPTSGAHGATSALAKAMALRAAHPDARILTQADWLSHRLGAPLDSSDENNALKLGYDPVHRTWPDWVRHLLQDMPLPQVHVPGSVVAEVGEAAREALGLPPATRIAAGTTDSIAATLAAGAAALGDGVTVLGTTLALKLVVPRAVFDPARGVYSHRLGDVWLAAGASNSGGAVLARFFSPQRLRRLSSAIDPQRDSGLDYYPLPGPGERFPVADPDLPPRLDPRPADDALFLHGLLEGIARIEAAGYRLLGERAGVSLRRVWTCGGGAGNAVWTALRGRILGVPVAPAAEQEAAVGSARLARCALTGAPPLTPT